MKKGLNIEVTNSQYEFLYDLVMMAYELDVPEQKGWDMQTFDNLVDNVCQAKETYLSNTVRGV
jgi:MoaA/NifB/PqqE/SkfB family radical SAM enzyme|tara:strand:- start:628 stop:816 length:189 start_codon:yes stop_codon:yes gene_type:complete